MAGRTMTKWLAVSAWATAALGCGEDTVGGTSDVPVGDDTLTSVFDIFVPDTATATDTAVPVEDTTTATDAADTADDDVAVGGFGLPCVSNPECASGYCVEGPDGFVCTRQCQEDCPAGYDCKGIQSRQDVVFLCLPRLDRLCMPCTEDLQCGGGRCLELDGERRCGRSCSDDLDCPSSFACVADGEGDAAPKFCEPATGSCTCFAELDGGLRTCATENDLGRCLGVSTCDPETGWSQCSAKAPTAEVCNGVDDDCDAFVDEDAPGVGDACTVDVAGVGSCPGERVCAGAGGLVCQGRTPVAETCNFADDDCDGAVDEDWKQGDVYASYDHCGTCNRSCAVGFPNAQQTACEVDHGVAQCVVVACEPGYIKQNDFQCIPDVVNLCEPCATDGNCLGQGSACVTLPDGQFCAKACAAPADCPLGFTCKDVGRTSKQCVPTTGVCSCGPTTQGLSRACSVTVSPAGQPSYTCAGAETCGASGWGACAMPSEVCNGVDDDCDAQTDEGFRDAQGRYDKVDNCGACGVSCLALDYVNSAPACDTAGAGLPRCGYQCDAGWVDVDAAPGCDCKPTSTTDLPDELGVDADCDGIDGEIDQSVFVAKTGDDAGLGTIDDPLRTIGAGILKAQLLGRRDVLVATGVYEESVALVDGVSVYGGYAPAFSERDRSRHESAILGAAPTDAKRGAVNAVSVGSNAQKPIVFDGFSVFGSDNPAAGGNSYAIYLRNVGPNITIAHDYIVAGNGGAGAAGSAGSNGAIGSNGSDGKSSCLASSGVGTGACANGTVQLAGGTGGSNASCASTSGGTGGAAVLPNAPDAVKDTAQTPTAGEFGKAGQGASGGTLGDAGWHSRIGYSSCGICSSPSNHPTEGGDGGPGGRGSNGAASAACGATVGSVDASGQWKSTAAGAGAAGANGSGGGGGGGAGGVDVSNQAGTVCTSSTACTYDTTDPINQCAPVIGGSGGGGGAGGCGAVGGGAGASGGGSFAVFMTWSTAPSALPTIRDNTVVRARGGNGGMGGAGGVGGAGGIGGTGGKSGDGIGGSFPLTPCGSGGGYGGEGGAGGHGAGGGGGCGGASYGVYLDPVVPAAVSRATISANAIPAGGGGGAGGLGGISIGNPGAAGGTGLNAATNF